MRPSADSCGRPRRYSNRHELGPNRDPTSRPLARGPATTAPGIYTVDGSGGRQGYILNSDGTLNSLTNPAATGSAITILIAGVGQYTLTDGYAVTPQPPAVFIDGFYCNGIAAKVGPVDGLPGNVFQLSVSVPDPVVLAQNNPDLKNFRFPPQSAVWPTTVSSMLPRSMAHSSRKSP